MVNYDILGLKLIATILVKAGETAKILNSKYTEGYMHYKDKKKPSKSLFIQNEEEKEIKRPSTI